MNEKLNKTTGQNDVVERDVASTQLSSGQVKAYETPRLICYGDVRDITLGPTLGGGESGCEGLFRVGPGGCP